MFVTTIRTCMNVSGGASYYTFPRKTVLGLMGLPPIDVADYMF